MKLGSAVVPSILSLFVALGAAAGPPAASGAREPWLHIRVSEAGDEEKVNINLPLAAVDFAANILQQQALVDGRIRIDDMDVSPTELKRLWRELRAAGDAQIASINDGGDRVEIFQKGDSVHIRVSERKGKRSAAKVEVEIPSAAVDALLAGDDAELRLADALAVLRDLSPEGDLVRVQDRDSQVRVWIE